MKSLIAMLLATAALAGCGGSSMSESAPAPTATPARPATMNFTVFTKELLTTQSDTAQPTAVTTAQFEFPDDENPRAFASVLPTT
jgi:ABC-type glycerol-3-phosphate transport system substrate-binding protein